MVATPTGTTSVEHPKTEIDDLLQTNEGRSKVFGRAYFNGGSEFGGYAREGMWDFPVHHVTASHIMYRRPKSVLEIGSARGYILKRLEDMGVPGFGLEISKHCVMTAVSDNVLLYDICNVKKWTPPSKQDLCFSVAVLAYS